MGVENQNQDQGEAGKEHRASPSIESQATSELSADLSGRELDAAVAERVMGWRQQPDYNYWMTFPKGETFKLHALIATWKPSVNLDTAIQVVEARIIELDLEDKYGDALVWQLSDGLQQQFEMGRGAFYGGEVFEITHATAEQRCRAALVAVTVNETERDAETTTER